MIHQFNEKVRLRTDTNNIIVEVSRIVEKDSKSLKAGDIVWEEVAYHGGIQHALKSVVEYSGVLTCESLEELLNLYRKVIDKIDELK